MYKKMSENCPFQDKIEPMDVVNAKKGVDSLVRPYQDDLSIILIDFFTISF